MANYRCFDIDFMNSDRMNRHSPLSQVLYYRLIGNADDEGFVANPVAVMRQINARKSHLQALVDDNLILVLEMPPFTGEVLIVDWWLHNTLNSRLLKHSEYKDNLEKYILDHPSTQNKVNTLYLHYAEQRKRREKKPTEDKPTEDKTSHTADSITDKPQNLFKGEIDPRNPDYSALIRSAVENYQR